MQIVIEIPKELYETYKGRPPMLGDDGMDMIVQSIANGTPLPNGHGDLKDMRVLKYVFDLTRTDYIYSGEDIRRVIESMATIIPADKETENG